MTVDVVSGPVNTMYLLVELKKDLQIVCLLQVFITIRLKTVSKYQHQRKKMLGKSFFLLKYLLLTFDVTVSKSRYIWNILDDLPTWLEICFYTVTLCGA